MFASQTRDLSHIELARSDNISSLSAVKAYRVNEVDISTEEKQEQEYKDFLFLLFFFSTFIIYIYDKAVHCVFSVKNSSPTDMYFFVSLFQKRIKKYIFSSQKVLTKKSRLAIIMVELYLFI